ncbi:MAG: F0F1 ATP synthase subunit delta [Patescibacteria group bacterium]
MKYSQHQLARVYVDLADKYSHKDLARAFAPLLLTQRKGRDIEKFSEDVEARSAFTESIVLAHVSSARKLSKKMQQIIASYIQKAEHMEHAHVISYTIDVTLIGGAVVQTATHTYTFSVHGSLQSIL